MNKMINKKKLYSYAGVIEVIPANENNVVKPMKCMFCHHRPCTCRR